MSKPPDNLIIKHHARQASKTYLNTPLASIDWQLPPIDEDEFNKIWVGGSILFPEAVFLYNMVRHFKPELILEAGAFVGISARFLAAGLRNNGGGHLVSVDYQSVASQFMLDRHSMPRSSRLTGDDRRLTTIVTARAQDFMEWLPDDSYDMVFEDASHSEKDTREICGQAMRILRPGGILMSHDALKKTVQAGYKHLKIFESTLYFNCGLSLWRKPE